MAGIRYAPVRSALAVLAGVAALVGAAALTDVAAGPAAASSRHKESSPVDVLYAGSLVTLMQTSLDAAFHRATGDRVTGIAAGSTALASEIKGGVYRADVFVSAAPKVNQSLEGPHNGNWERWYLEFATSPLELGYDPQSRFAPTLRTKPWWRVVTSPGFLLGRTNPATDPKGVLAVKALHAMAIAHHDPALAALGTASGNVFPEQTMVGRLQAGQLDAGFFYAVEAAAAKIPAVPLTGVHEQATYTVSVLARAPHARAAIAFVRFLLGPRGRRILSTHGLRPVTPPKLSGRRSAVPEGLRAVLRR